MSRSGITRLAALLAGSFALSGSASAYYYYLYFTNGVQNPGAPAKFDFSTLVNNTVSFYVSSQGPSVLAPGDSYQAIVSEIEAAANVWNSVPTSAIQLSYGGLFTPGRIDIAPSIDIQFSDDIPPGLLAYTIPETNATPTPGPNGAFVQIGRSLIFLQSNMTNIPVYGATPSYSETFFVTLVHEFGHSLGLQHNLASSVMSTLVTTASSKASPLSADDKAGVSLLYPTTSYLSSVGAIGGHVTMNGSPVVLASVVAISPTNAAISTFTNPDGSYLINGIPPDPYYVYVHPLPPTNTAYGESTPDNIWYPLDPNFNPIGPSYNPATSTFAAQFYSGPSGTRNWQQAQSLPITAGTTTAGINFSVSPRTSEAIYSVRTYGNTSAQPVIYSSPAPVMLGAQSPIPVVATGAGLLQSNQTVTPGLSINTLGSVAQLGDLAAFPPPYPYIELFVLNTSLGVAPGPKHLLFSTPNDLYVLPSAFMAVINSAPFISSVTPTFDTNANRAVVVAGTNLRQDTTILFDGLQGTIETVNLDGSLLVTPPPALAARL